VRREREEGSVRAEIEFDDGFVVSLVNVFELSFEDANGPRRLHGGDGGGEGARGALGRGEGGGEVKGGRRGRDGEFARGSCRSH